MPESIDASDVADRLATVVGRLNRRIRSAGGELSHGLLSALAATVKFGPLRLAELGQLEFVSAPSTTRIVAELERRGFVTRAVDPDDGRAFLLEATPEGVAEVARARSKRSAMVAELLGQLTPDQLEAIATALPAIETSLESSEQPPSRR